MRQETKKSRPSVYFYLYSHFVPTDWYHQNRSAKQVSHTLPKKLYKSTLFVYHLVHTSYLSFKIVIWVLRQTNICSILPLEHSIMHLNALLQLLSALPWNWVRPWHLSATFLHWVYKTGSVIDIETTFLYLSLFTRYACSTSCDLHHHDLKHQEYE